MYFFPEYSLSFINFLFVLLFLPFKSRVFSFIIGFSLSFALPFPFSFILRYLFVLSLSFISIVSLVLCFLYCSFLSLIYFHIPALVLGDAIFKAKCKSIQYYMPEVVLEIRSEVTSSEKNELRHITLIKIIK